MFNIFSKNKKERNSILGAFPKLLRADVNVVLDILPLGKKVPVFAYKDEHKFYGLIHEDFKLVSYGFENLKIPIRIYMEEPDSKKEDQLSERQRVILNCIYLRHSNGFIRQRRLENLAGSQEIFVPFFTLQLLGEHVFELLDPLDRIITKEVLPGYKKFILENPKYWRLIESRMVSYWNEYYRRAAHPKLNEYIGKRIVDRLNKNL